MEHRGKMDISLIDRATFIHTIFPHELKDASIKYLAKNLRTCGVCKIALDIPKTGDYHSNVWKKPKNKKQIQPIRVIQHRLKYYCLLIVVSITSLYWFAACLTKTMLYHAKKQINLQWPTGSGRRTLRENLKYGKSADRKTSSAA